KTVPAPAANPAAKDEVGGAVVTARTAPTATRPNRSGRETGMGSTAGIIEAPSGYYLRLKNKEDAMRKLGFLAAAVVVGAALPGPPRGGNGKGGVRVERGAQGDGRARVHGAAHRRREGRDLDRERAARAPRAPHPREGRLLGGRRDVGRRPLQRCGEPARRS